MSAVEKQTSRAGSSRAASTKRTERRRRPWLRINGPPKPDIVKEFQPDAVEMEQRKPPRVARSTLYCVMALILAAIGWAAGSKVDMIVAAPGKLVTARPNFVVQPLETSVIRDVRVRPGDVVKRGDVLATLDPTFSQADLDQLRTRVAAYDAMIDRLNAELGGYEFVVKDPENPDYVLQQKMFVQRRAFYQSQIRNFEAQIASARANFEASQEEEAVLTRRLETMRSIESMRATLMDKEVGSKLNFLLSRDARLEVESSLSRIRGNQADYNHKVEKARAEKQVFADDFRRAAYQDLVETLAKRNSTAEDLKKVELRRQLIVLAAPADSVVLDVPKRTIGSVVREAEPLFVLVPRDVSLQAEVRVDGKDVAQVAVGQPVRIKLEAFPFQKYGTASGVVRVISQDAFAPATKDEDERGMQAPYYRVLVEVTDATLRLERKPIQMIPGMAVTAELKVGRRTVISYFLYPLLRGLDESIREY